MKLPTENANGVEEQPVVSAGENGGPSGAETGGSSQPSASSTSSSGSNSTGSSNAPSQSGPEVDFSEYLWMENEEEFDSQVIQELEDEEMINYYYELYEASLNDNGTWGPNTANIRVTGPPPPYTHPSVVPPEEDPVESLTQGMNTHLSFSSRLNPEAAEFIPGGANMSTPN